MIWQEMPLSITVTGLVLQSYIQKIICQMDIIVTLLLWRNGIHFAHEPLGDFHMEMDQDETSYYDASVTNHNTVLLRVIILMHSYTCIGCDHPVLWTTMGMTRNTCVGMNRSFDPRGTVRHKFWCLSHSMNIICINTCVPQSQERASLFWSINHNGFHNYLWNILQYGPDGTIFSTVSYKWTSEAFQWKIFLNWSHKRKDLQKMTHQVWYDTQIRSTQQLFEHCSCWWTVPKNVSTHKIRVRFWQMQL